MSPASWTESDCTGLSRVEPEWDLGLAPPLRLVLASVNIAEFQHHHGMHPKVFLTLETGERCELRRERGNPYDYWAIAVYTQEGARLGYVPRGCNQPIAALMDQGVAVLAEITSIQPEADPWERVRVLLRAELPGVARICGN